MPARSFRVPAACGRCAGPSALAAKARGARVIYFWRVSESQILLLAIYAKGERTDLSPADRKALRKIVENWQ